MNAAEESKALQETEQALLHLLNDNVAEADRLLNNGDSSFHCLGRGVAKFIAAMFASEKELLKSTAVILAEAEQRTWDDMKRAESDPGAFRSEIYPPGTEYLLAYCCKLQIDSETDRLTDVYRSEPTFRSRMWCFDRFHHRSHERILQVQKGVQHVRQYHSEREQGPESETGKSTTCCSLSNNFSI